MWADCCVSHGYALEIRAVLPLTLRLLPLINYRVELCFSFCLFFSPFVSCLYFASCFFCAFFYLGEFFLAVKCDICNTLLTYCWPAERLLGPSVCLWIWLINPLRHYCCSCRRPAKGFLGFFPFWPVAHVCVEEPRSPPTSERLSNLRNKFQFRGLMNPPRAAHLFGPFESSKGPQLAKSRPSPGPGTVL